MSDDGITSNPGGRRSRDDDSPLEPRRRRRVRGDLKIDAKDWRGIARLQRWLLLCILAYILFMVAVGVVRIQDAAMPPAIQIGLAVMQLAISLVAAIFVLLLAMKVYNIPVGILLFVLTLIPCVNLLILLLVNGKATSILQLRGIRVGLLGANMADLAEAERRQDRPGRDDDDD